MTALRHPHRTTKDAALRILEEEVNASGYGHSTKWDGFRCTVSYGPFGSLLLAQGEITDEYIVVEKISGAMAPIARSKIPGILKLLFPD